MNTSKQRRFFKSIGSSGQKRTNSPEHDESRSTKRAKPTYDFNLSSNSNEYDPLCDGNSSNEDILEDSGISEADDVFSLPLDDVVSLSMLFSFPGDWIYFWVNFYFGIYLDLQQKIEIIAKQESMLAHPFVQPRASF